MVAVETLIQFATTELTRAGAAVIGNNLLRIQDWHPREKFIQSILPDLAEEDIPEIIQGGLGEFCKQYPFYVCRKYYMFDERNHAPFPLGPILDEDDKSDSIVRLAP